MRNEHDIIATLKASKAPDLGLPLRRERFIAALTARARARRAQPSAFVTAFATMLSNRKLLAGGIAVLALAAAVTLTPSYAAKAQAKGAVNRAIFRFAQLSPEQRAEIDQRIKDDMAASLEEALHAPDLRIISKEEFEQEFSFRRGGLHGAGEGPDAISIQRFEGAAQVAPGEGEMISFPPTGQHIIVEDDVVVQNEGGGAFSWHSEGAPASGTTEAGTGTVPFTEGTMVGPLPEPVDPATYLRYTNKEGAKAIVGLDEDGTPVMKVIAMSFGDGEGNIKQVQFMHNTTDGSASVGGNVMFKAKIDGPESGAQAAE